MPTPEDEDVEDYVHLGTPLQEEVESRAGQYAKALADPASTKSLPVWKQVELASCSASCSLLHAVARGLSLVCCPLAGGDG